MTFIVLMVIAKFGVEVLGWHSWNCVVWCRERQRERGEGEEREREREREKERERERGREGGEKYGKIYKNNTTCVRLSLECTEKCGHFEHIFGIHNIST